LKSITAFLVALVVATPAAAEGIIPREGSATAEREGKSTGDIARKAMDQFAACVLDRRRKLVLQALAMPSDSPEQNKEFGYLAILSTAGSPNENDAMAALANVYGQCLYEDNTLRFSKGSLIGLLAEAYYRDGNALAETSAAK